VESHILSFVSETIGRAFFVIVMKWLELIYMDGGLCMAAGIILEYEQGGFLKTKSIDLLDLRPE